MKGERLEVCGRFDSNENKRFVWYEKISGHKIGYNGETYLIGDSFED